MKLSKSIQELFTCKTPFADIPTFAGLIAAITQRLPDRPSDEDTHSRMTQMWWDMCSKCWNKIPSSRPTMATLVNCIAEIVGSLAAASLVTYQPLQVNLSHSSIPNGALKMNGSITVPCTLGIHPE